MGVWVTYRSDLAQKGQRVASWPNHRGEVMEGMILCRYGLYDEEWIEVEYMSGEKCHLRAETGRYSRRMDTSLDVGLIWQE